MGQKILQVILSFIGAMISVLMAPINAVLSTILPGFGPSLGIVSDFVDYIKPYVTWGVSYTGLSPTMLSIISILCTTALTLPVAVHVFKLAIKWYNALKL